jgi:hypothetical protein
MGIFRVLGSMFFILIERYEAYLNARYSSKILKRNLLQKEIVIVIFLKESTFI